MDVSQELKIVSKLQKLWPAWKTTDDEIELYQKRLKHYDYDVVCEAIEEHKATKQGGMNSPKIWHIIAICKDKGGRRANKRVPVVNYWVECVENEEQPWRKGEQVKFWATDKRFLLHGLKQEKSAEQCCKQVAGLYGGKWEYRLINFDIEYEGPAPF